MEMNKSTHQGHCQVCGRIQAIMANNGLISKHGYKVHGFGYFVGTCRGSDAKPMQEERSLTDDTVQALVNYAADQRQLAADFSDGTVKPVRIHDGHDRVVTNGHVKYVDKYIDFKDGTEYQQKRAVEACISGAESEARQATSYAYDLNELADKVFATDLIDIVATAVARREARATVVTKASIQRELDKLSQEYRKLRKQIQEAYLVRYRAGEGMTTKAKDLYFAASDLYQWNAKWSKIARAEHPSMASVVTQIENLVTARNIIKGKKA